MDVDAAREFADEVAESDAEAADTIRGLADEVRELRRIRGSAVLDWRSSRDKKITELEAELAALRNEDVRGRMEEMQRENARLIAKLVQLRTAIADSLSLSQDLTSKLTEAHRDAEFGGE